MRHDPAAFVVPYEFWNRPVVQDALEGRDIGALFRLLRKYAGASQTGLMMRVGIAKSEISPIMAGRRQVTTLERLEAVADGLAMPADCRMQMGLAPGGRTRRPAGSDPGAPTSLPILPDSEAARAVELTYSVASIGPWLADIGGPPTAGLAAAPLDPALVAAIGRRLSEIREFDDRLALPTALDLAVSDLRVAISLIPAVGQADPHDSGILHRHVAGLAQLAGWLSFDRGLPSDTQQYWSVALRAAQRGGAIVCSARMSCPAWATRRSGTTTRASRSASSRPLKEP